MAKSIRIFILLILLLPLWLWLAWLFKEPTPLPAFILDNTVLNEEAIEHKSVNWILTHEKFVKTNGHFHHMNSDYYGFFPKEDEKFEIRDLRNFSEMQLDSLSQENQLAYIADSYGIYVNEWYRHYDLTERSRLVYGGLRKNEVKLLQKMKSQGKLVVMEFNSIASPTAFANRKKIEDMYHFQWSGWTGRYFALLDSAKNPELPRWVVRNYSRQHRQQWPFKRDGIVLVHSSDRIEILEMERDLQQAVPKIAVLPEAQKRFALPDSIAYPYWFDVLQNSDSNRTLANYHLFCNARGDSILNSAGIPKIFPAVIEHLENYRFYYFAGDFADNPVSMWTARLRWIEYFKFIMHKNNISDRRQFFWEFYQPMVSRIFKNYQQQIKNDK